MTDTEIAALAAVLAQSECHTTKAGTVLLDEYAIQTATCCGLAFEMHDETVTDHVVRSKMAWNAQLHDLVDNIERQAAAGVRVVGPDSLEPFDYAAHGRAVDGIAHEVVVGPDSPSPGPWVVERGSIAWMVREGEGGPQIGNFILEEDARFVAALRSSVGPDSLDAAKVSPDHPDHPWKQAAREGRWADAERLLAAARLTETAR